MGHPGRAPRLRILVVCTANQCRSPLIEHQLQHRCQELGLPWDITSCGTHARAGLLADPSVRRLLEERGQSDPDWRSRLTTLDELAAADLIITSTLENRKDVVRLDPGAARHTFLIVPLARYFRHRPLGVDRPGDRGFLLGRIEEAGANLSPTEEGVDLDDPVGRRFAAFRRLDREVDDLVSALVGRPRGSRANEGLLGG